MAVKDASLTSLSMQLVESAVKLKKFYHSMAEALGALNCLAYEVETMSPGLKLIERHRQSETHGADLMDQCIKQCRRHVASIEQPIGELSRTLGGERFVRIQSRRDPNPGPQ
jgi:hypothetical protein